MSVRHSCLRVNELRSYLAEEPPGLQAIRIVSSNYLFHEAFDRAPVAFTRLEYDIDAQTGRTDRAMDKVETFADENPSPRKPLREDPNLESLHNIYEFRVLTGMQEPTTIDNINLPTVEAPKPK